MFGVGYIGLLGVVPPNTGVGPSPPVGDFLLLADGSSFLLLTDAVSKLELMV